MSEPKKPTDPPPGENAAPDLDAFAVFDPEAGEEALRKRLNLPQEAADEGAECQVLAGAETVFRAQGLRQGEADRDRVVRDGAAIRDR